MVFQTLFWKGRGGKTHGERMSSLLSSVKVQGILAVDSDEEGDNANDNGSVELSIPLSPRADDGPRPKAFEADDSPECRSPQSTDSRRIDAPIEEVEHTLSQIHLTAPTDDQREVPPEDAIVVNKHASSRRAEVTKEAKATRRGFFRSTSRRRSRTPSTRKKRDVSPSPLRTTLSQQSKLLARKRKENKAKDIKGLKIIEPEKLPVWVQREGSMTPTIAHIRPTDSISSRKSSSIPPVTMNSSLSSQAAKNLRMKQEKADNKAKPTALNTPRSQIRENRPESDPNAKTEEVSIRLKTAGSQDTLPKVPERKTNTTGNEDKSTGLKIVVFDSEEKAERRVRVTLLDTNKIINLQGEKIEPFLGVILREALRMNQNIHIENGNIDDCLSAASSVPMMKAISFVKKNANKANTKKAIVTNLAARGVPKTEESTSLDTYIKRVCSSMVTVEANALKKVASTTRKKERKTAAATKESAEKASAPQAGVESSSKPSDSKNFQTTKTPSTWSQPFAFFWPGSSTSNQELKEDKEETNEKSVSGDAEHKKAAIDFIRAESSTSNISSSQLGRALESSLKDERETLRTETGPISGLHSPKTSKVAHNFLVINTTDSLKPIPPSEVRPPTNKVSLDSNQQEILSDTRETLTNLRDSKTGESKTSPFFLKEENSAEFQKKTENFHNKSTHDSVEELLQSSRVVEEDSYSAMSEKVTKAVDESAIAAIQTGVKLAKTLGLLNSPKDKKTAEAVLEIAKKIVEKNGCLEGTVLSEQTQIEGLGHDNTIATGSGTDPNVQNRDATEEEAPLVETVVSMDTLSKTLPQDGATETAETVPEIEPSTPSLAIARAAPREIALRKMRNSVRCGFSSGKGNGTHQLKVWPMEHAKQAVETAVQNVVRTAFLDDISTGDESSFAGPASSLRHNEASKSINDNNTVTSFLSSDAFLGDDTCSDASMSVEDDSTVGTATLDGLISLAQSLNENDEDGSVIFERLETCPVTIASRTEAGEIEVAKDLESFYIHRSPSFRSVLSEENGFNQYQEQTTPLMEAFVFYIETTLDAMNTVKKKKRVASARSKGKVNANLSYVSEELVQSYVKMMGKEKDKQNEGKGRCKGGGRGLASTEPVRSDQEESDTEDDDWDGIVQTPSDDMMRSAFGMMTSTLSEEMGDYQPSGTSRRKKKR